MTKLKTPKINIIIPVYEDLKSLISLISKLGDEDLDIFFILVDDFSWQNALLKNFINDLSIKGVVLNLPINMGHQGAIAEGLKWVSQSRRKNFLTVIMDGDGEDNPKDVKSLINTINDNQSLGAVVATRLDRHVGLSFKIFYRLYLILILLLTGHKLNFGNFSVLKPRAVIALCHSSTTSLHYSASIVKSKIPFLKVPLRRGARYFGFSKMNMSSLFLHGLKGIAVFSETAALRVGIFCLVMVLTAVTGMFFAICIKLFGYASPGWFSITVGVLFIVFFVAGVLATLLIFNLLRSQINQK